MKNILLFLITLYQNLISPILVQLFAVHCRYEKSCSEYAKDAIEKHGALKGLAMSFSRLLSCQPFSKSSLKLEISPSTSLRVKI